MFELYPTAAQIESIAREARQARAAYLASLIQSLCHRLAAHAVAT
jgi:hypothetical protein